jgi:hypothetical protein
VRDNALQLEQNDRVKDILLHAHEDARDVAAAKRMLGNLLGQVLAIQEGLFDTKMIAHPDLEQEE